MSWFGGVRTSIPVTSSETFLMAGEARELIEAETGYGDHDKHPLAERPSDDWAGAATLLLARVQLQEAIAILSTLLGEDVSHWTPERLGEELTWRVEAATDDGEDDLSFEIGMLGEALTLFRALHVSPTVSHAYAPDGSISFTHSSVRLPEILHFGIKGNSNGELEDDPATVFAVARGCTLDAARVAERVRRGKEASGG